MASSHLTNGSAGHDKTHENGSAHDEDPILGWDNVWTLVHEACGWNPVCGTTMTFRGRMTKDKVVAAFERRQRRFPKFGQKLTNLYRPFARPAFEDAPRFQVEDNVEVVRLGGAADRDDLEKLMGHLLARDWDYSRPLWQCVLVENYSDDEGAESALLTRWHHTLADGQGYILADVFCTDYHDELVSTMNKGANRQRAIQSRPFRPSRITRRLRRADALVEVPVLGWLVYLVSLVLYAAISLPGALSKTGTTIHAFAHIGWYHMLMWWRLQHLSPPQLPGPRVRGREYASSKQIHINDVKTVQKAFGRLELSHAGPAPGSASADNPYHVTLNHVAVSVVTEVFTDLLHTRSEERTSWQRWFDQYLPNRIALFIPMSTRKPGDWTTGNRVTGVVTQFPFAKGEADEDARRSTAMIHQHLHSTKAELELLKHSWTPRILEDVIAFMAQRPILFPPFRLGMIPIPAIQEYASWATRTAMMSIHGILTNIPVQAKEAAHLEGIEVLRWTAVPPQGEKGTLGLGLVSYANHITLSVVSDKVPGREGFARQVCEAFEAKFAAYLGDARDIVSRDA